MAEIKQGLLNREYAQDPSLRPRQVSLEEYAENLGEALQRTPAERRQKQEEFEAVRESQEAMDEHKLIQSINGGNFMGIAQDALGVIGGFLETAGLRKPRNRW
ncbi:MAG: hypothetical protein JO089_04420 [Alphaproteobacteria bacterium]|nr:hypothetical protein [Alphaproteobacteria bacterium]